MTHLYVYHRLLELPHTQKEPSQPTAFHHPWLHISLELGLAARTTSLAVHGAIASVQGGTQGL